MPPLSYQQSTTSYSVPEKLPFIEIFGGIAQLGERLNGIQEVSGSIPLISTKGYAKRLVFVRKQAFSLFCDEIGISSHFKHSPKGAFRVNVPLFCVPSWDGLGMPSLKFPMFFIAKPSYIYGLNSIRFANLRNFCRFILVFLTYNYQHIFHCCCY